MEIVERHTDTQRTVLVADDEPDIREMLSEWIVEEGWRALQAEDGEMALEKLRTESVQVALIDLMMPGLDGLQLLGRMQTENIQADVVMISGHGSIAVAVEAIKRGAHDFIEKPFRKSEVVSLVRDLFESHHPMCQNLVTRLDRFVMDHATDPDFRLGDVCVRVRISSRYVSKLFKNHYGETFRTRLVTYRIRRAKQLMEQTDEPLYLIAERSGFKDYRTLTAALKRVEGITPRRYRQTITLKSGS
jgi:two-component system response regulator YesN